MHRTWRWLAVLAVFSGLLLGVMLGFASGSRAVQGSRLYRYPFERATRGSVTRTVEQEIAFYQARARRDPAGGLDRAALGQAYLKMARATGDLSWYLLADAAARSSLRNLPFHNNAARLVLARVAEARHDFPEAIRLARQVGPSADALSVEVSASLAMGRVDDAAQAAATLTAQSPGLASLTLRGLVRIAQGRDGEAIADFTRAIAAEEPGEPGASAWARVLLGRLHAKRGRLEQARALYGEALRILPQHPLALLHLAELEARAGRYDAAERLYARVITVSEASPNVYDHAVLRGLARMRRLRGDETAAAWDQAETRLRRDAAGGAFGHRGELARLLLERGRAQDLPEALALMEAETRIRRDPETLDTLAWALSSAGRWREARQVMREALRWGLRDAALHDRVAVIARALGNQDEARRYLELARAIDPSLDARARRALGLGF